MLDLQYFQNSGNVNTQTFTNAGTWATWVKPKGAKFVSIICIGSGAGGGGGLVTGSASARYGGGGGGGGAVARITIQASILSDILYVYTGAGGIGGTAGNPSTSGGNGEKSYVCLTPNTSSASNIVIMSGGTAATGGGGGTVTAGSAGAAETVFSTANIIFLQLGVFANIAAGGAGSASPTTGTNTSVSNPLVFMGGRGGGANTAGTTGQTQGGGFTTTLYFLPSTIAGVSGAPGRDGIFLYKPILFSMAGIGGSSGGSGAGANGGNGGYGSGGGGGGAGVTGAGNGGKGGDGLVIITTSF